MENWAGHEDPPEMSELLLLGGVGLLFLLFLFFLGGGVLRKAHCGSGQEGQGQYENTESFHLLKTP
jgi:hypothetical protein